MKNYREIKISEKMYNYKSDQVLTFLMLIFGENEKIIIMQLQITPTTDLNILFLHYNL